MRKFLTTPRFDKRLQSFLKHHTDLTINVRRMMDQLVNEDNELKNLGAGHRRHIQKNY